MYTHDNYMNAGSTNRTAPGPNPTPSVRLDISRWDVELLDVELLDVERAGARVVTAKPHGQGCFPKEQN